MLLGSFLLLQINRHALISDIYKYEKVIMTSCFIGFIIRYTPTYNVSRVIFSASVSADGINRK